MSLEAYAKKRDFSKTPEPKPSRVVETGRRFFVQKHAASRLHFDLRLEIDGTLKSWALPKGFPMEPGEKHLAVHVEDHPLDYGDFEGIIPAGQYGGGTVMLWDRGDFDTPGKSPSTSLKHGRLHVEFRGKKLQGTWHLIRLKDSEKDWLIIKSSDASPIMDRPTEDRSILTGRTMEEITKGKRPKSSRREPLPHFVKPMLAKLVEVPPSGQWNYEVKFDGWRALVVKDGSRVRLLSRNDKELGGKFPGLVQALEQLNTESCMLDGEITALDSEGRTSFQLLQGFDLQEEQPPLCMYLFDVLHLDGANCMDLPLEERKHRLENLLRFQDNPILKMSPFLGSNASQLLKEARRLALEGLIGKRPESRYQPGSRNGDWIKLKLTAQQEFVIGGFTNPEGSRKHFGSLIVGYYENGSLQFCGKVGTGFTEASLRSMSGLLAPLSRKDCPFANLPAPKSGRWNQGITRAEMKQCHWVEPKLVAQIKFQEWTSDNRLRQPVFLGMRNDKAPREVGKQA